MRKILLLFCFLALGVTAWAEGSESLQKVTKDVYGLTSAHTFTGDNGMTWTTVGAIDCTVGGFRALTVSAGVPNNGIQGQLNATQVEQGVGEVSFSVKGIASGTGYGDRTFRVTVGNKVVEITMNIPNINTSCRYKAVIKRREVSDIAITALETVKGETATFAIYDIQWTSYNGKTDKPTFVVDDEDTDFILTNGDTTYYAEENISINLSSTTEGALFYYTTDGSKPTTSASQGSTIILPAGQEYTLRMIAWTDSLGTSDETTWIINTAKGKVYKNPCESTTQWAESSKLYLFDNAYTTKSGTPCYRLATSSLLVTPTIIYPQYLSFYATSPSKTITISYQTGVMVEEKDVQKWEASEWIKLQTISVSEFTSGVMKYFQIEIPDTLKTQFVRFQLKSSGNSSYVDDVNYITPVLEQLPTPTSSIPSGEVVAGTTITIAAIEGTTLHYTLNGGVEQITASPLTLTITEPTTIRAYATQEGMAQSWIAEYIYTLNNNPTNLQTVGNSQAQKPYKLMQDGHIYIVKHNQIYDIFGRKVK